MKLRDKLNEILPALLPARAQDAIKGNELIARLRAELGEAYSDHTLRSQFSFLVLAPDSCLARVENGQGYFLRAEDDDSSSLHRMFETGGSPDAQDPTRKALALAVRLFDTAGMGVFVYPPDEWESWAHPDFVAVEWPAGTWESGAYIFEDSESTSTEDLTYCAVCVAWADSPEGCRRAFYRTLACGLWAQRSELLLLMQDEAIDDELLDLAARFGVGIRCLSLENAWLAKLPGADSLFRASAADARALLELVLQSRLSQPRHTTLQCPDEQERPDVAALMAWVETCLQRGRVESYEMRVAVN